MAKIAIISTRLGGIDGVSIEADKWAKAYSILGLKPVYIAGNFKSGDKYYQVEEMDFYHPHIMKIRRLAFNKDKQGIKKDNLKLLEENIFNLKDKIKGKITDIIDKEKVTYLSIENALSIPLNIPLGIALSEIISERNIKTITRHHDFYWERKEFLSNKIQDILDNYFPPDIESLKHVVINTIAQNSLKLKKNITADYIPNVFDFEIIKKNKNRYKDLKKILNLAREDYLFIQPTRIIRRKGIERSIELVDKLSEKIKNKIYLFITGKPEKDEIEYFYEIINLAKEKRVRLIINENNGSIEETEFLKKNLFESYDIYDVYFCCDMVTLPSDIEGFGNPVIEACAFKKLLFVNNYPVLSDMLSKGFDFVVINGRVTNNCIEKIYKLLTGKNYREKMLNKNYKIARKYYSMEFLVKKLKDFFL